MELRAQFNLHFLVIRGNKRRGEEKGEGWKRRKDERKRDRRRG